MMACFLGQGTSLQKVSCKEQATFLILWDLSPLLDNSPGSLHFGCTVKTIPDGIILAPGVNRIPQSYTKDWLGFPFSCHFLHFNFFVPYLKTWLNSIKEIQKKISSHVKGSSAELNRIKTC